MPHFKMMVIPYKQQNFIGNMQIFYMNTARLLKDLKIKITAIKQNQRIQQNKKFRRRKT